MGGRSTFVPAIFPLVCGLDLLCAALLVRQFRDSGDARVILVASAYVFSLVVLAGSAGSVPGRGQGCRRCSAAWPSTAPWLWVAWHTGFPVLLAAGVGPWPDRWSGVRLRVGAPADDVGCRSLPRAASGTLMVAAAASGRGWLPVVIDGLDTSALTRVTGPVVRARRPVRDRGDRAGCDATVRADAVGGARLRRNARRRGADLVLPPPVQPRLVRRPRPDDRGLRSGAGGDPCRVRSAQGSRRAGGGSAPLDAGRAPRSCRQFSPRFSAT